MPKNRNGKTVNPIAHHLNKNATGTFKKRVNDADVRSKHHSDEKKGSFSRDAKHKKKPQLEEHVVSKSPTTFMEFYQVGDKLDIIDGPLKKLVQKKNGNTEVTVREPSGPSNTLGITIDGKYYIIDEDDVKLITESFDYDDLTEWSMAKTLSGIAIPISTEEKEIIDMCKSKTYEKNMDMREEEMARRMVSRGVLQQGNDDTGTYFISGVPKLTRS